MKEKRIWQINEDVVKDSLWIRIKRLFGFELSKPPHEDLCHRFKKIRASSTKPPVESLRDRFNRVRASSGYQPTRPNPDAVPHTATADDIVNVVLAEISKISPFSQEIKIGFIMKSGWEGYIRVWLYPQIYYGEPYGHKTAFLEIYLVENDPSFSHWKSVSYTDTTNEDYRPSYNIHLNTKDLWDRECSHYSGIWSVSWVEFLNKQKTL